MSLGGASLVNAHTSINDFEKGKINLKSGETLEGYVAPLAKFSNSSVLYKTADSESPISIHHENINSIVKESSNLKATTIQWNGKSTDAYLEAKESGSFKLYKAHFYAPMKRGKNNSTTELQSAWVVYSPIKGYVVLGKNVKASDLNKALEHPKNTSTLTPRIVDENQLIEWVRNLNQNII